MEIQMWEAVINEVKKHESEGRFLEVPWTKIQQSDEITSEQEDNLLAGSDDERKRTNDNKEKKGNKPKITSTEVFKHGKEDSNYKSKLVTRYYLSNFHFVADDPTKKTTTPSSTGQSAGSVQTIAKMTDESDKYKTLQEVCQSLQKTVTVLVDTNLKTVNAMKNLIKEYKETRENERKETLFFRELMNNQSLKFNEAVSQLTERLRELDYDEVNENDIIITSNKSSVAQGNELNREDISSIIRDELNKLNSEKSNNLKQNCLNSVANDSIEFEVINKESGPRRDYKLTSQTKFDHFYDFLTSELRSNELLYVINDNESTSKTANYDENTKTRNKYRVRDIIINRIDQIYYSKISSVIEPVEIINKLKEIKRCETNLSSVAIRKQLYDMQYVPSREKAED